MASLHSISLRWHEPRLWGGDRTFRPGIQQDQLSPRSSVRRELQIPAFLWPLPVVLNFREGDWEFFANLTKLVKLEVLVFCAIHDQRGTASLSYYQHIEAIDVLEPLNLREAILHEGGVSRRLFLAYAAGLSAIPLLGSQAKAVNRNARFSNNPFTLGVASGDPTESGVALWTRLAPSPLEPGGGLSRENIEVVWEIAEDESMRKIVHRGTATATPQLAHSVHVEFNGLAPDRWYWYRFRVGGADSPIGRTRTTPARDFHPSQLKFAFASCQHYESGLFTAYEHMAEDDLDLVFHLGDYIYEDAARDNRVRKHVGRELHSLDDYRIRHAQYKTDPLLQAMHAACPWFVTWDDHEVSNDYANDVSPREPNKQAEFLLRRANAYQAYYEMMPLRRGSLPRGPRMQLYRNATFGKLAEFLLLDTRQYRTRQPDGGGLHELDKSTMSARGTILGTRQTDWLKESLLESTAHWNVLAQQVLMAMIHLKSEKGHGYPMDKWPGYTRDRLQLVEFIHERQIPNPIVLTGDIHCNWVNNLRVDDRQSETPVVATEFVGTSISSGGNGEERRNNWQEVTKDNPCVQFYNGERGYVRCTVTPELWQTDFRVVEDVTKPGATAKTRATFVVEAGEPGAKQA